LDTTENITEETASPIMPEAILEEITSEYEAQYVDLTELTVLEAKNAELELSDDDKEEVLLADLRYPSETDLLEPELLELKLDHFHDEDQEDKLWQARTGLAKDTLCGAIETIIFMSDKPVSLSKIKSLIDEDLPLRVIHESMEKLQAEYELKHHGIRLQEVAEGYQFRTKATYSKFVQDLFKVNALVLTPVALEVLAIIAYKQPLAKTEVDKIRGVDSSHIVRGLMDKRLVKVCGRSEELGKPVLYGTTQEFMEVFNLSTLSDLPPEHELQSLVNEGMGSKIGEIKTIVSSGDKQAFQFDEIDELDALSESIKQISSDTDFTKSLKVEEKKRKDSKGEDVKTAFDLLEEFVQNEIVCNENQKAGESELFTAVTSPEVIRNLNEGPFNLPNEEEVEEEEEFQMIDLDTGLPIEDEFAELATEETELEMKTIEVPEESVEEIIDAKELLTNFSEEREELSKALDDAFSKLTGEDLNLAPFVHEEEIEHGHDEIEKRVEDIELLTKKISEDAAELDINLGFLDND
jgi:segregation and condensation protein B